MNHKVNFAKYFKEQTNTEIKREKSNNFKSRSNSRSFSRGKSNEKSDSNIKINFRTSKRNTFNSNSSKVNTLIIKQNENIIKSKKVKRLSYKKVGEIGNKKMFKDESNNYLEKLKSLNYENNMILEKNRIEDIKSNNYQSIVNKNENKIKRKMSEKNLIEKMNNNYLEKKNYLNDLNKKKEKIFKKEKSEEIKNNSFIVEENFPNHINFKNIIPKEKLIYTTSVTKKNNDFENRKYQEHIKNKKSMDILKEMEESEEISVSKNNIKNQEKKNENIFEKDNMIYNINERFTLCEQNRDYKIKSESSLNLKSIEENPNLKNTDYPPYFSKNIMKKLSNSRKELPELLSVNISENSKNQLYNKTEKSENPLKKNINKKKKKFREPKKNK